MFSRRNVLATTAVGMALSAATARAATFGNPDEPPEGAVNVTNPKALTDPGPQDQSLAANEPAFLDPPATDVNGMPQYWASFNLAPKRIQNGRGRSPKTISKFRRASQGSICALAPAGFVSFTGISKPSGPL